MKTKNNFLFQLYDKHLKIRKHKSFTRLLGICIPLLCIISLQLFPQLDTPCECATRWEEGGHWNDDGTIDETGNIPNPQGIIRCGNAADTQAGITSCVDPGPGVNNCAGNCVYDPASFEIDLSDITCFDPNDESATPNVAGPNPGCDIIWLQFDIRPNAGTWQFQLVGGSDQYDWALFASTTPDIDGDPSTNCDPLNLQACGSQFSNTWSTITTPAFLEPTNYYIAIWNTGADCTQEISINAKFRNGCGVPGICSLQLESDEISSCNTDETYDVCFNVAGSNGVYEVIDSTGSAITVPDSFALGLFPDGPFEQTVCVTYPNNTDYNVTVAGVTLSNSTDPCDAQVNVAGARICCEVECDDGDCNTNDAYNSDICECEYTLIPQPDCNDNDCTTEDSYDETICQCVYTPIPQPDCNDNDCTTEDSYNPTNCTCVNTPFNATEGCTDPTACNYDADACIDNGTCLPFPNCNDDICVGDITIIDPTDSCTCIVDVIQVLGCTDENACNYDPVANCDDGSCEYAPIVCDDNPCATYTIDGCECIYTPNSCIDDTQAPIVSLNPDANWPDGFDPTSFVSGQTIYYECGVPPLINSNSFIVEECCEFTASLVDVLIAPRPCGNEMYCYYEVKDAAGNSTIFEFFVTFTDTTPPVIDLNPEADGWTEEYNPSTISNGDKLTFQCNDLIDFDETYIIASDLCDPNVDVVFENTLLKIGNCVDDEFYSEWSISWIATDTCGYSTSFSLTAYVIDETPPTFDTNSLAIDLCDEQTLTIEEFAAFTPPVLTATDDCSVVTVDGPTISDNGECSEYYYDWTARDACENETTYTLVVCVNTVCNRYCTHAKEFYGNFWGQTGGNSTLQIVNNALLDDPIVLGVPGQSYTISNPFCIMNMLSGQDTGLIPSPLPSGDQYFNEVDCTEIDNILVENTIALTINMRNSPDLANLKLANSCLTFNYKVYNQLGYDATIQDVLDIANSALGGEIPGRLMYINTALNTINNGFIDCNNPCESRQRLDNSSEPPNNINLQVYPTITSSNLNIDCTTTESKAANIYFYNQLGELIQENSISLNPGQNNHQLDIESFATGIYLTVVQISGERYSFKILKSK